jgi:methyl-accepting chemotaxis protein
MQQNTQVTLQGFLEGLQHVMAGMQEGNSQIAQGLGQIAQMVMQSSEKSEQQLAMLVDGVQQSNKAVVAALTQETAAAQVDMLKPSSRRHPQPTHTLLVELERLGVPVREVLQAVLGAQESSS